jgi:hypothetical protein
MGMCVKPFFSCRLSLSPEQRVDIFICGRRLRIETQGHSAK